MPSVRRSDPFVPQSLEDYLRLVRVRRGISRRRRALRGKKATETRIKTAALLTYTGPADPENGDWTTGLTMSPCVKGNGWEKYKADVLATPGVNPADVVESVSSGYQMIAFNGTAAIPFMRLFDLVFLGHFPGANLIQAIRANGGPKIGLYFFNFETISQAPAYNPWYQSIDDISLAHLFISVPFNVNGCKQVDQLEALGEGAACGAQAAGANGHTWLCALNPLGGYQTAWAAEVSSKVAARYPNNIVDYLLVDNVLGGVYPGVATNFLPELYGDDIYQTGQKAMFAALNGNLAAEGLTTRMMGNAHPTTAYYSASELHNRYSEHFFHLDHTSGQTTAESIAELTPHIQNGLSTVILGAQIVSSGAAYAAGVMAAMHVDRTSRYEDGPSNATWAQVRAAAQGRLETTYILAARSSGSAKFALFTNGNLRWR